MSSVVISGDSSGTVSLTVPSVAGTNTATLPAATGTVMVSGNMPAFSAYASGAQTFADSTYTKVTFDVEEFDTNNNFASSRFTPTVAGYYTITAYIGITPTVEALASIYKNGTQYKRFTYNVSGANQASWGGTVSSIYMNGTTDYLEFYMFQSSSGASKNSNGTQQTTYINGCMTRAA